MFRFNCKNLWTSTQIHSQCMYNTSTCTIAVCNLSPLNPMTMEDADITRGPHTKRMAIPMAALLVPQAMIRGWRAMKSPAYLAISLCHCFYYIKIYMAILVLILQVGNNFHFTSSIFPPTSCAIGSFHKTRHVFLFSTFLSFFLSNLINFRWGICVTWRDI